MNSYREHGFSDVRLPNQKLVSGDINHLLDTLQEGDPVAADQLLVLVYAELRRLAAAKMARESAGILLSR